ncbi:MAG: UDP-N-acetylmuramate--L-alanine ligase [Rickettsiales bacterium]|nr:UDP-N-acetylmuramate--L-alanine ligase [Rickettsiales bacterium]
MIHLNKLTPNANLHFSGIGGIGMSGLAEIMFKLGYNVQGTDITNNAITKKLEESGIKVFYDHKNSDLSDISFLIKSSAIKDDNYEIQYCIKNNIPIVTRAELLASLMTGKVAISVSGTHGKTTTTSFIASLLEKAGLDPTVIVGGIINHKKTNAYLGMGSFVVVEADESDGTFIRLPSTIAVATNIDREHMDFYKSYDNLKEAFRRFIEGVPFYGFGVLCIDNKELYELSKKITSREIITYSVKNAKADVFADNIKKSKRGHIFDICLGTKFGGIRIKDIELNVPGVHSIQNSLAAASVAARLHLNLEVLKDAFAQFDNVKRRFTLTGEVNGVRFIDDYAHHPREIEATLSSAKQMVSDSKGKVFAIFQPHRYSRTRNLFDDFIHCFKDADILYIADIYAASEDPIEGISKESLVEAIKQSYPDKQIQSLPAHDKLPDLIKKFCNDGDMVLFLGAGSITEWAYNVPEFLRG